MSPDTLSLWKRPIDVLFVVVFCTFITSIVLIEHPLCQHGISIVNENSEIPRLRLLYDYGINVDPLFLSFPSWIHSIICTHAYVAGPLYVLMAYAFIVGGNWIRIPCLMYCGAMMSLNMILGVEEHFGPVPSPDPVSMWTVNALWVVTPMLLLLRMLHENPFMSPPPPETESIPQDTPVVDATATKKEQ